MSRRFSSNAAVAQQENGYLSPPASGSRDKCTCAHTSEDDLDDPFIDTPPRVCDCGAAERRVIPPASEGLASSSPAGPSSLGAQQGGKRKRAAAMPAYDTRYMTYVFRGTRVTYATRAPSEDSDDEPYVPRLLFPHAHRSSQSAKRAAAAATIPSPATSTTSDSTNASGRASPTATHSTGATSCQSHDEEATVKSRSPRYVAPVPAPSKRPNLFASQIERLRQQAEEKHAAARASGKAAAVVAPHSDLTARLEAWSDSEDDEDDKGEDVRDATARARATHEYWATYEKAQAATEEMQQPEPYADAQPFYPSAASFKREAGDTQQAPRKKRCVR